MRTLTWKVTFTRPTACPDYIPDPYTGQYPTTQCLVYHCETVTENKCAEFETEKNALEFASKAPSSCTEFKLDGVEIEDKRPKTETSSITLGGLTAMSGTNQLSALTEKR